MSILARFVVVASLGVASGCATITVRSELPEESASADKRVVPIPSSSAGNAQLDSARTDALLGLAAALEKSKGPKVELSRKLLEDLIRAEHHYQTRCDRLSLQLEALKSIDVADPRGMQK
ncbi:MAG: hypothetical protein A2X94_03800 [Bdellovibrionales bacterium GWB1_55_8]|nr:MAG: hypothetical protein A2X94_03800 [Bdellovibrionales bacterium GWB1_55_8]